MAPSGRFCINTSKITHETIDGEVVIVNLASGSYYSLDGAGADIWNCIESRASLAEIVEQIAHRFDAEASELTKAVNQLVDGLLAEGLILKQPDNGETNPLESKSISLPSSDQTAKGQFSPPTLHKYTDMKDLLLLDPIHDVDEAGWPTVKPDAKKEDGKV